MADLENLLLEAAGRTTASGSRHQSRMQAKRSYSDEPSYAKSS